MDKHSVLIERLLPELTVKPHVTGVMLQGSVATLVAALRFSSREIVDEFRFNLRSLLRMDSF